MKEFVLENWDKIAIIAITIITSLIYIIIKRKPFTLDNFKEAAYKVVSLVPSLCEQAETEYGAGHGEDKKRYVISCCMLLAKNILSREITKDEAIFISDQVGEAIEDVLSAPARKEIVDG